jgi:hypothetical protein
MREPQSIHFHRSRTTTDILLLPLLTKNVVDHAQALANAVEVVVAVAKIEREVVVIHTKITIVVIENKNMIETVTVTVTVIVIVIVIVTVTVIENEDVNVNMTKIRTVTKTDIIHRNTLHYLESSQIENTTPLLPSQKNRDPNPIQSNPINHNLFDMISIHSNQCVADCERNLLSF